MKSFTLNEYHNYLVGSEFVVLVKNAKSIFSACFASQEVLNNIMKDWFLNTVFHLTNLAIKTIYDYRKAWLPRP
jgi:hypothetical protein